MGTEFDSLRPHRNRFSHSSPAPAEVLEERIVPASLGLPQDLIAFHQGAWTVGVSNGTNGFTTSTWVTWANAPWRFVGQGDFNGDGRTDVIGLIDGDWWVGISNGVNAFVTSRWARWINPNWTEIQIGDLNGDGLDEVVARTGNQYWAALSQGNVFGPATLWANAGGIIWDGVFLDDVNGDGAEDLVVLLNGNWLAALSTGTSFTAAQTWSTFLDVDWNGLTTADMNFDGLADVVAFLNGAWYIGFSTGSTFEFSLIAQWSDVPWRDVRVGDFDGNGFGDFVGRFAGQIWVSTLAQSGSNISVTTVRWGVWNEAAGWTDTRIGDFNGDGRDDIASREGGHWWVARSTGTIATDVAFATSRWATWAFLPYRFVATAQVNNVAAASAILAAIDDEPVALFWSQTKEDEEFAAALLT